MRVGRIDLGIGLDWVLFGVLDGYRREQSMVGIRHALGLAAWRSYLAIGARTGWFVGPPQLGLWFRTSIAVFLVARSACDFGQCCLGVLAAIGLKQHIGSIRANGSAFFVQFWG